MATDGALSAAAAARNREIFAETRAFADALGAAHVIFHGGIDGSVEETVRQLKAFGEKRALIENKPFVPLPNSLGLRFCRGATADELGRIIDGTGCGFCLDVGHAVCSANAQGHEPYAFVAELARRFRPAMFHLSDVMDMSSPYDAHPHLGAGKLDIPRLCRELFPADARISIETVKDSSAFERRYTDGDWLFRFFSDKLDSFRSKGMTFDLFGRIESFDDVAAYVLESLNCAYKPLADARAEDELRSHAPLKRLSRAFRKKSKNFVIGIEPRIYPFGLRNGERKQTALAIQSEIHESFEFFLNEP